VSSDLSLIPAHPAGESISSATPTPLPSLVLPDSVAVDTPGGRVHVEWDTQAPLTPMGQLVFFTQFLKTAELYEPWVDECPLVYTSPNAPEVGDVLGTTFLSVLAGHHRYAHVTALRHDTVNPPLLKMSKVVSEDSMRRAFEEESPELIETWQRKHLRLSYQPLLYEPWILDVDTTIKTLYGRQEGAQVGYNPHKRGRPSHVYHTYFMGSARLALDVEVQPGKQTAAEHSQPGLWRLVDELTKDARPWLIRGDCHFGNESLIAQAEAREQNYLFKLRLTRKPKELIRQMERSGDWKDAGQGWEGREGTLCLQGWSRSRRVIILRRKLAQPLEAPLLGQGSQLFLNWTGLFPVQGPRYEYAVLVTNLTEEILTLAQLYRDRADMENNFDELKNQWGWGGFVTKDLLRCLIAARTIALIYNWWSLFVRLADPSKRREAITSRPLLLGAVGRRTTHSGQVCLTITPAHGEAGKIREMLTRVTTFLTGLMEAAEQLTSGERWHRILSKIFEKQLGGRPLKGPALVLTSG
jgi:Transposase DDE domain group 1